MKRSHDIAKEIHDQLIKTAEAIPDFDSEFDPQIRTADERFGDFQANGTLPFAKKKQLNPRELAQTLIDALPENKDWEVSLAGPGFINFKLSSTCLYQL